VSNLQLNILPSEMAYFPFIKFIATDASDFIVGMDKSSFTASVSCQLDVVRCLGYIGRAAQKVLPLVREVFPALPWSLMDEMQVLSPRSYNRRDADFIWGIVTNDVPALLLALDQILPHFSHKWQYCAVDTILIPAGYRDAGTVESYPIFIDDTTANGESATGPEEEKLVKGLFSDPKVRGVVFPELGAAVGSFYKTHVKNPVLDASEMKEIGDIDVLICHDSLADKAIAAECKRVKIIWNQGNADSNKISEIRKGISQARSLHKIGFHQVYLAILIVVDARGQEAEEPLFRGMSRETFNLIYKKTFEFALGMKLHDDIGITFIEIVQPSSKTIDKNSVVRICVPKEAITLSQPGNRTIRVEKLMRENLTIS
jgi:uncharacterized protein with HEPN domain